MSFYLDCDTTPTLQSRYWHAKRVESAKARAMHLIERVTEGQIGIYEHSHGGEFYGYAIKHAGEQPYFEEPETEAPAAPIATTETTTTEEDQCPGQ